jgi:hypothetical protein
LKKAAEYLLNQQDETGAIWPQPANKKNVKKADDRPTNNQTAMTSLSLLALASLGHQPSDQTPEGQAMRKALTFVLSDKCQDDDGYFGIDGSKMYGHGITTLMLSEMLGMGTDTAQDESIRQKCRKAIDLILRAQKVQKGDKSRGGWRYAPDATDSDMSVTVWQTMALRAAKNAGLDVPKDAIDDAIRYIKRGYEPASKTTYTSGAGNFGYQGPGRLVSTTAEGLLALQVCGEYESEEVRGAAEALLKEGSIKPKEQWFFYYAYYYATGMYQRGGKYAEQASANVREALLPMQGSDGSWLASEAKESQAGPVYATSMAILSLAVKNHFLPIYQR